MSSEPPAGAPKSALLLIFLTVLIDMIGFGMIIPLLPLYAKNFAAPEWQIGWLIAIYSLVQFFSGPLLGRWSDRVGRRKILLVSLFGTAVGFFIMGAANTLALLFAARILAGFTGGNISTAQAYIADVTTPETRAKGMGLIGAAFGIGFIFGPALGGLLSQRDLTLFGTTIPAIAVPFYFAGVLALLNTVAVFFRLPESLPAEKRLVPEHRKGRLAMWHDVASPQLTKILLAYLVAIIGFSIMTTSFALFTFHRFDFSAADNGYTFAFLGFIGVVVQGGFIGRLTKKFGERSLAIFGSFLIAVGFILMPVSRGLTLLFFATGIVALGNSLIQPTLNTLASRATGAQFQGSVLGLMASAGSLGRTVGPLAAGWLLTLDLGRGPLAYGQTAFWVAAALMFVSCGLTVLIQPTEPAVRAL